MTEEYRVITNPFVKVTISGNTSTFAAERRFQKDLTIAALKGKLELVTGATAASMKLQVFGKDDKLVCDLDNNDALLGSYPVDDNMRIHVIDKLGQAGDFDDVSKVEKYEMSADNYSKRTDSVRAFKEKMKMGEFKEVDPETQKQMEIEKIRRQEEEQEKAASIAVGSRCEVTMAGQPAKRGVVMYVGFTDFKPGYWVGVKYDEPLGKNDGSVKGKRYFECEPKYGGFMKPLQVTTGDFPELGIEDLDEM